MKIKAPSRERVRDLSRCVQPVGAVSGQGRRGRARSPGSCWSSCFEVPTRDVLCLLGDNPGRAQQGLPNHQAEVCTGTPAASPGLGAPSVCGWGHSLCLQRAPV